MALEVTIYRFVSTPVLTVKPDKTSGITKRVMGDDSAILLFELNKMVYFRLGDTAVIYGDTYKLNKMPLVTKTSRENFEYTMTMQAYQYDLAKAQYMFYDRNNILQEGDFSLTGTAEDFIKLLVTNINRISTGWTKGLVTVTAWKTLTFSKEDCYSVLTKIAAAFETEWYIEGQTINLQKQARTLPGLKFKYGLKVGLWDITRTQTDSRTVTRLYAFGSTKNLPPEYPGTRLRLPMIYTEFSNLTWTVVDNGNGTQTITFRYSSPLSSRKKYSVDYRLLGDSAWTNYTVANPLASTNPLVITVPLGIYEVQFHRYLLSGFPLTFTDDIVITDIFTVYGNQVEPLLTGAPLPFLEKNTDLYGIIEGDFIDENIFPERTGTVTGVDATNIYRFTDAAIDFDINTQLLPGITAKLTFNTGQLAGYQFELSAFDNATKTFTILKNKDEKALDIPNSNIRPLIGDKYVLTDIMMPQSYVTDAENRLQAKAQAYLDLNSSPIYQYSITCDPKYLRKKQIAIAKGDIVWLEDIELEISKWIRVVELKKSLLDEYEYQLELGEVIQAGRIDQIQSVQIGNSEGLSNVSRTLEQNAMLEGRRVGDLTVEKGTLLLPDILPANTAAMKGLFIDDYGKVWKAE